VELAIVRWYVSVPLVIAAKVIIQAKVVGFYHQVQNLSQVKNIAAYSILSPVCIVMNYLHQRYQEEDLEEIVAELLTELLNNEKRAINF
jgi:hypothetical protein